MTIPISLLPRESRPFDVVGFGVNSVDLIATLAEFPRPDGKARIQTLETRPGGQVATAMVGCARLGCRVRYLGRFGSDRYGSEGIASLEQAGVDVTAVQRVASASSHFSVVLVDQSRAERTVLWHRPSSLWWPPEDMPGTAIQEGRVLHVDCFEPQAALAAARLARAAGMATVIDVEQPSAGIDDLLHEMDVIIAAESFPHVLTGVADAFSALEALAARFPRAAVVCVTLGEQGSLARCQGQVIRTPAFQVNCVDSTGAGDLFRAGFLARWVTSDGTAELEDVLRYANAAAALNCRGLGARGAIPTQSEVNDLLHST